MLASEIITAAMREGNTLQVGTTPTDSELSEALGRLNGLIRSLFGHGISEELTDWMVPGALRTSPVAADYPQLPIPMTQDALMMGSMAMPDATVEVWPYPPQCSRIVVGIKSAATVYFPEQPSDGARMGVVSAPAHSATLTLDGNGRYIDSAATATFLAGATGKEWLYRADIASWMTCTDLALTSDSPLPPDFDDLLICGLALRLSPRLGFEPKSNTKETFTALLSNLATRYTQARRTVFGAENIPNTYQGFPVRRRNV